MVLLRICERIEKQQGEQDEPKREDDVAGHLLTPIRASSAMIREIYIPVATPTPKPHVATAARIAAAAHVTGLLAALMTRAPRSAPCARLLERAGLGLRPIPGRRFPGGGECAGCRAGG